MYLTFSRAARLLFILREGPCTDEEINTKIKNKLICVPGWLQLFTHVGLVTPRVQSYEGEESNLWTLHKPPCVPPKEMVKNPARGAGWRKFHIARLLAIIALSPKTARELSDTVDIKHATIVDYLNILLDHGLVQVMSNDKTNKQNDPLYVCNFLPRVEGEAAGVVTMKQDSPSLEVIQRHIPSHKATVDVPCVSDPLNALFGR